ncbi:S8 family peptidase [Paenibacillus yanchengensis]|uniref:S8 family peptidase n=1 Tax=Paenibacillus yanchengensis TaxID=2035833 RepID=A0ABW4YK38_9BACL
MHKSWIASITVLILIALIIPGLGRYNVAEQENKQLQNNLEQARLSVDAEKEKHIKQSLIEQDVTATMQFMQAETDKDLGILLQNVTDHSEKNTLTAINKLMKQHPYLVYISLTSASKNIVQGHFPPTNDGSVQHYITLAKEKLQLSESYRSPKFTCDKGSIFSVVATPDHSGKDGGAIAVVKQDVMKTVELQQQKNLRLIPYPAEGNYRIKSVAPNSTVDITVSDGEDNGAASHYHIRDVVVRFEQKLSSEQLQLIQDEIDGTILQQLDQTYIFRSNHLEAKQLMEYFQSKWQPIYTEPNFLYMTNQQQDEVNTETIIPNDVLYSTYQWNLPSIATEKGWNITKGNEGVIVAVLDTGVEATHPDLIGRLVSGANMIDNSKNPTDNVGHGTHVAGIIGATVNNKEGVAGVSWYNKIMPIKVLDDSGAGSSYSVAQGVIWAVDQGAKVINMSLGNYANSQFLHDAIKYAYAQDVVLIAASGNDNTVRPGYPAAYPEVFAVAATNSQKERAPFSNYGDYIDVAAPGESIASTYPGHQYAALSGTSMATPHVSALAGLIRSVNPDLSNEEVMNIIRNTSIDLGNPGKDDYFGYGEINVSEALTNAMEFKGTLQMYPSQVKRKLKRLATQ